MSEPRVSIIMPVFNRAEFIGEAIDSLRRQPEIAAEILVIDDGSTDGSDRIVEALAAEDSRVKLIRQDHQGVSAARNAGLAAATGDYITFLDSDDICAPGKIIRQIRKFEQRPDITAVVGHRMIFNQMGPDFQPAPESIWIKRLDICLASAVFRRATFDTFGGFDPALTYGEDIDFYFRLFETDARFIIETDIAIYYRRHDGNMTNDEAAMHKACLRAYHNSMLRRRAMGRTQRLKVFFFKTFDHETEFGGPDDVADLAAVDALKGAV